MVIKISMTSLKCLITKARAVRTGKDTYGTHGAPRWNIVTSRAHCISRHRKQVGMGRMQSRNMLMVGAAIGGQIAKKSEKMGE